MTKKELTAENDRLQKEHVLLRGQMNQLQEEIEVQKARAKVAANAAAVGGPVPGPRVKTPHQRRIEDFMRQGGQAIPDKPMLPDGGVLELRARLVLEEALEFVSACGCRAWINNITMSGTVQVVFTGGADLVKITDGAGDLSVVSIGSLSACGISDMGVLKEIDENNLLKVADGVARDSGGKIQKPTQGWRRPELGKVLLAQGYGSSDDGK